MAKFTLLELNLDGAEFTANAPFSNDAELEPEDGESETADESAETGSTAKPWLAALVGLLFLVLVAVLAKKKLGGSDDDEEYTDPEAAGFGDD